METGNERPPADGCLLQAQLGNQARPPCEFLLKIANTALDPTLFEWRPFAIGVQIDGSQLSIERQVGVFLEELGFGNFVFPHMDQYHFQHYERQLHNFKYTSDLYPEWGWMMRWIFHSLDTKRAHFNGKAGFDPIERGSASP